MYRQHLSGSGSLQRARASWLVAHGRRTTRSRTTCSHRADCGTCRLHRLLGRRDCRGRFADPMDLARRPHVRPGRFGWMARDDLLAAAQAVSVDDRLARLPELRRTATRCSTNSSDAHPRGALRAHVGDRPLHGPRAHSLSRLPRRRPRSAGRGRSGPSHAPRGPGRRRCTRCPRLAAARGRTHGPKSAPPP